MKEYTTVDVERGLAFHGGARSSISTCLNDLSREGWEVVACLPSFNVDGTIILEREKAEDIHQKNARAAFEAHEAEKYDGERQNGEYATPNVVDLVNELTEEADSETSWLEEKEKEESNDGEE
ncbi:hypothetical protein HN911_13360 [Candidatus Bathyarchaeota archaeon]|jgi:hypothetical protein|nr:hypothetical protein [Candidatus Bathyarchaeota archaeon]